VSFRKSKGCSEGSNMIFPKNSDLMNAPFGMQHSLKLIMSEEVQIKVKTLFSLKEENLSLHELIDGKRNQSNAVLKIYF
jgi:hypothetical protein